MVVGTLNCTMPKLCFCQFRCTKYKIIEFFFFLNQIKVHQSFFTFPCGSIVSYDVKFVLLYLCLSLSFIVCCVIDHGEGGVHKPTNGLHSGFKKISS